jgi:hypothetical protein
MNSTISNELNAGEWILTLDLDYHSKKTSRNRSPDRNADIALGVFQNGLSVGRS